MHPFCGVMDRATRVPSGEGGSCRAGAIATVIQSHLTCLEDGPLSSFLLVKRNGRRNGILIRRFVDVLPPGTVCTRRMDYSASSEEPSA